MQPTLQPRGFDQHPRQPLHVAQLREALLKIQTVTAVTGLSESSVRRRVAAGLFPQPVKDGTRCTRWVAGQVTDWLTSKAQEGGQQ